MFKPFFAPGAERRILSIYTATIPMNAGALVDLDTSNTVAVTGNVGFTAQTAGQLLLATAAVVPTVASVQLYSRFLGFAIPTVNATGPDVFARMLRLGNTYMTIPQGANCAVYLPTPGDLIATTEFVGYLAGDSAATGKIDTTNTANLGKAVEAYQGRFRLCQAGNFACGRYLGNTTANGAAVGIFQIL